MDEELDIEVIKKLSQLRYNEEEQLKIIMTLKSDYQKISAMKIFIRNEKNCVKIINSLNSIEKRIEFLDYIENPENQKEVLNSFSGLTDEQKYKIVKKIKSALERKKVILSIADEKIRIKCIPLCLLNAEKKQVILTLSNEQKIRQLRNIDSILMQGEIIDTIEDEQVLIRGIQENDDENTKTILLMKLNNDFDKEENLECLKKEINRVRVIATFFDDEEKIKWLKQTKSEQNRALILMSLQDREKLLNELQIKDVEKTIGIDKNITTGLEIECEGDLYQYILELGYTLPREEQDDNGMDFWGIKVDTSLSKGVEAFSPILTDCKRDVEDIYIICKLLKIAGMHVSERCGGHIHLGADYFKTKLAYTIFLEICSNTEEILYTICNKEGSIPRNGVMEQAKSISNELYKAIKNNSIDVNSKENLDEFIKKTQETQQNKRYFVRLENINKDIEKNTIEFRGPNGTLDPETWIENIRLFARLMEVSKKLSELETKKELSEKEKRMLLLEKKIIQDIPIEEKLEILLELLFEKEEQETYRNRYIVNSKLIEAMPEKEIIIPNSDFKRVDFKRKHRIDEFEEIALHEKQEDISEVIKETMVGFKNEKEEERE